MGIKIGEIAYQAIGWKRARRIIVIRQNTENREAPGKSLSLFPDDRAAKGRRYGAFVTDLALPAVEVWRTYRGRADSTLHGMVLAVGGAWKNGSDKNHLLLSVPRKKRAWFCGCGPIPQVRHAAKLE